MRSANQATFVDHGILVHHELESLYGFIDAYVKCPESMKRPFLPYRDVPGASYLSESS
jgi:hypothetical protein